MVRQAASPQLLRGSARSRQPQDLPGRRLPRRRRRRKTARRPLPLLLLPLESPDIAGLIRIPVGVCRGVEIAYSRNGDIGLNWGDVGRLAGAAGHAATILRGADLLPHDAEPPDRYSLNRGSNGTASGQKLAGTGVVDLAVRHLDDVGDRRSAVGNALSDAWPAPAGKAKASVAPSDASNEGSGAWQAPMRGAARIRSGRRF